MNMLFGLADEIRCLLFHWTGSVGGSILRAMKLSQKLGVAAAALFYCTGAVFAGGEGWTSDFAAAQKSAQEGKKDLILDFTGSDWCGYCIKLNDEVFSKDAFKAAVKDKFVLVEVDFPQDESKLSAETKKQNEALQEKYPIEGYPTLFLTDSAGLPYGMTGYQEGGAEPYVKHLNELVAKKKVRDDSFAAAEKAEGVEKAKALVAGLSAMELPATVQAKFYGDVIAKIKAADPQDTTGFGKKQQAQERVAKFQEELQALGEKQDIEGALALVDKTLAAGGLEPDDSQKILLTKAMIYGDQGKFDEAIKVVADAKKMAPESEIGKKLDGFTTELQEAKKEAATAAKEDDHAAEKKDAPKAEEKKDAPKAE